MIESHLISWHGIYNSTIELHNLYGMVDVNARATIACALRWGVAFGLRGNDTGRVPRALHKYVFPSICSTCKSSRVPGIETRNDDSA